MLSILNVEDLKRHFPFWLAVFGRAVPIPPAELPKSVRDLICQLNADVSQGEVKDYALNLGWACRFTGIERLDSPGSGNPSRKLTTWYLAGHARPGEAGFVILEGPMDPSDIEALDEGIDRNVEPGEGSKRMRSGRRGKAVHRG